MVGSGVFILARYVSGVITISGRLTDSRYSTMAAATLSTPGFSRIDFSRSLLVSWVII